MFSLIEREKGVDRGSLVSPELNLARSKLSKAIDKIVNYYRTNFVTIDRASPIYRLVWNLNFQTGNTTPDIYGYYQKARTKMDDIAIATGITTSSNKSAMSIGYFYGNIPTAILAEDGMSPREIHGASQGWESLSPMRILACPVATGVFARPDKITAKVGYAVISVDIPMLAVMYNMWQFKNNQKPEDEREGIDHFIGRYLYPNAMRSQADAMVVNMLNSDSLDLYDINPDIDEPPIALYDNSKEFAKHLSDHVKDMRKSGFTLGRFISNIPGFVGDDLLDGVEVLEETKSTANRWAVLMASLPMVRAAAINTPNDPGASEVVQQWKMIDRQVRSYRALSNIPADASVIRDVQFMYKELENILKDKV